MSVPAILGVYILLKNYVSSVYLNTTFEISSSIVNPTFSLNPTSDPQIPNNLMYTYMYAYNANKITFAIGMQSGSNIKITIYTGDELQDSLTPNIEIATVGDWNNGINNVIGQMITYNYTRPGDFQIKVNLSNTQGFFLFSQTIRIISKVDNLIPSLRVSPVYFKTYSGIGLAEYMFTCDETSKAGSHSLVTFWPGDSTNATYGPFTLGMDFIADISRVALSYTYISAGNYTSSFLVSNILGSKVFTLSVNVVISIDMFYIDVVPKYALPNQVVTITAYMLQGNGVSLSFFQNSNQIGLTNPRVSTSYLIGDSRNFTASSVPQSIFISVLAADAYSSQTQNYTLQIQNPVSLVSFSVNPTGAIINDDCKSTKKMPQDFKVLNG